MISIPNISYPKVFGKKNHYEIGHIRDVYSKEAIVRLLESFNLKILSAKVCMKYVASILYTFYFRTMIREIAKAFFTITLKSFLLLDYYLPSFFISSSLIVLAKK
ncbi:MAG: hypothetical protein N2043_01300 [Ignavibacterium sp.]|nr:hypothetical protein [Ignavibacterium sp.]